TKDAVADDRHTKRRKNVEDNRSGHITGGHGRAGAPAASTGSAASSSSSSAGEMNGMISSLVAPDGPTAPARPLFAIEDGAAQTPGIYCGAEGGTTVVEGSSMFGAGGGATTPGMVGAFDGQEDQPHDQYYALGSATTVVGGFTVFGQYTDGSAT
ncbi:unnamed protein product, partial [Amoebophrya sp. A120]